jgi:hypothetical protein
MIRILKTVLVSASFLTLLALSSRPAASWDFNPFGWGPPATRQSPAEPRARTGPTPRPPAEVEITGAITAGGDVDDTVRFIAGMQPPAGSPLAALTNDESWRAHARFFDRAFGELDRSQLSKARAWAKTNLRVKRPTMYYMFSGPDFLYADAFFPEATTYVLAALEPVGQIPDLSRIPRGSLGPSLHTVSNAMHTVLSFSFFITHNMRSQLSGGRLNGTIPILYVFLARSGKTVKEVSLVNLDADGNERPEAPGAKSGAHGVKILFAGADGKERTLYYFSTNIADDGVSSSGFLKFCAKLGPQPGQERVLPDAQGRLHQDPRLPDQQQRDHPGGRLRHPARLFRPEEVAAPAVRPLHDAARHLPRHPPAEAGGALPALRDTDRFRLWLPLAAQRVEPAAGGAQRRGGDRVGGAGKAVDEAC